MTTMTRPLSAVRHPVRGKAHLLTDVDGSVHQAACGRELVEAQVLPWEQTAPEDRCTRCARCEPVRAQPEADERTAVRLTGSMVIHLQARSVGRRTVRTKCGLQWTTYRTETFPWAKSAGLGRCARCEREAS